MSSIPEKQQPMIAAPANKTRFFFRKDSIQKIKCTAMYPFQVAGIKLSKNAIIELLETNIMKARVCTQKAVLNFYIVILKLLSTLFTLCDNVNALRGQITETVLPVLQEYGTAAPESADTTTTLTEEMCRKMRLRRQQRVEFVDDDDAVDLSVTSIENNVVQSSSASSPRPQKDSYQSRLLAKLERIQRHKSRINGKSLRLQSTSSESESTQQEGDKMENTTNDLTKDALEASTGSTRTSAIKHTLQPTSSTTSPSSFFKEQQQRIPLVESKLKNYCLILCVHAGLLVMYLQVLVVGLALNSAKIPSGLLFLIATIAIIGYILFKVCFFDQMNGQAAKKSQQSIINKQCSSDNKDASSDRQGRSTKRRPPMLDIDSKTLSKVKLL